MVTAMITVVVMMMMMACSGSGIAGGIQGGATEGGWAHPILVRIKVVESVLPADDGIYTNHMYMVCHYLWCPS